MQASFLQQTRMTSFFLWRHFPSVLPASSAAATSREQRGGLIRCHGEMKKTRYLIYLRRGTLCLLVLNAETWAKGKLSKMRKDKRPGETQTCPKICAIHHLKLGPQDKREGGLYPAFFPSFPSFPFLRTGRAKGRTAGNVCQLMMRF